MLLRRALTLRQAQFDARQRGKKELESSSDSNEGTNRSGEGGRRRACYVVPNPSFEYE